MKGLVLTVGALAAALSLTFGLGSASASSASASAGAKVGVAASGLGRILVDGRGHTLYLFAKDRNGKSSCSGSCAVYWPPLITSGKPRAVSGASASLLGTTRRADGRLQVTYRHHPLYTYAGDAAKGQTSGQGLDASGGKWWVLSPAGDKIVSGGAASTATTTTPADPGYGGYGYRF
jgi:predicted lipoprotein with Yx(FWY)xxD motif